MRKFFFVSVALIAIACSAFANARITYVDTQAAGYGETEQASLKDALINCIAQVTGQVMNAKEQVESAFKTVNGKTDSSESFQSQISVMTKGVIASYEIKSVTEQKSEIKTVVAAKIAKFNAGANSNRLRIVVTPFTISENACNITTKTYSNEEITNISTQSIVNKLVATRKFMVLDRENTKAILGEKAIIMSGDCPLVEMCKMGQVLSADYIVVGVVNSITSTSQKVNLAMSGLSAEHKNYGASLTLRFIDVATKQIKFSDVIDTRVNVGTSSESELVSIFNQLSDLSIKKIMNHIYPLRVVAVNDGEVVLNQGGDSIKEGDFYEVFELGETIKDPYTGESLGQKETKCATIEIIRVKGKSSDGKIVSGSTKIQEEFNANKRYICRLLPSKPKVEENKAPLSESKKVLW